MVIANIFLRSYEIHYEQVLLSIFYSKLFINIYAKVKMKNALNVLTSYKLEFNVKQQQKYDNTVAKEVCEYMIK